VETARLAVAYDHVMPPRVITATLLAIEGRRQVLTLYRNSHPGQGLAMNEYNHLYFITVLEEIVELMRQAVVDTGSAACKGRCEEIVVMPARAPADRADAHTPINSCPSYYPLLPHC